MFGMFNTKIQAVKTGTFEKQEAKLNERNHFEPESFEIADLLSAGQVFSRWQAEQAQDVEDYLMRQRKAELNALVKKVIENELSESNKMLVKLRWDKEYSLEKIAQIFEIDTSTVHRRLEKITDDLYEKLKYALEYRFGKSGRAASVLIKSEIQNNLIENNLTSCSARLRALRKDNHLSLQDVSQCTGICEKRLIKIESGKPGLELEELVKLASFFKVSTDYLIFGKLRVLRDPLTGLPVNCRC